jgi:hypothetical protein
MFRFSFPKFCSSAKILQKTALEQLHKELQRDIEEKTSSNIPIPPKGWTVRHRPGSCVFQLQSLISFNNNNRKNSNRIGSKQEFEFPPNSSSAKLSNTTRPPWMTKVDIHARFETVDPSFWEPSSVSSICEYVPFRVILERVEKISSSNDDDDDDGGQNTSTTSLLFKANQHQQRSTTTIHTNLLVIDCAQVQSQLRIRRIFFAPVADREALEDESAIGMPHGVYCGPEFSDKILSKELVQSVMELLSSCGIDNRIGEYICQVGYCYEHEEYELWLAKLGDFAGKSFLGWKPKGESEEQDEENPSSVPVSPHSPSSISSVAKDIFREQQQNNVSSATLSDEEDDVMDEKFRRDQIERDLKMKQVASKMSSVMNRVSKGTIDAEKKSNEKISDSSSITGKPRKVKFERIVRN